MTLPSSCVAGFHNEGRESVAAVYEATIESVT